MPFPLSHLAYFSPELILVIGFVVLMIMDVIRPLRRGAGIVALVILAAAAIEAMTGWPGTSRIIFATYAHDPFALFFKVFFCLATMVAVLFSLFTFKTDAEYYLLLVGSALGMTLLSGAHDLILLFLAIEMVSIPSYILAGAYRNKQSSGEAALKYVLYGAVSTGVMLFGMSLLYGLTGTTDFGLIREFFLMESPSPVTLFLAMLFIMAGLGYKIAMVPFHFWCPDVYEGAPTPITAFFSVAPKAAGLAALLRLTVTLLPEGWEAGWDWPMMFTLASAATMTLGNLAAIRQQNLKRLLAYSSIAHAGYILMGFASACFLGFQAVLFYLVVYLFMNFGAFFAVDIVARKEGGEMLRDFRGLGYRAPFTAVIFAIFLFSLVGLPPLAGFIGKFYLFAALIQQKMIPLAIIGVLNSVVSLWYYVKVVREMFLRDPLKSEPIPEGVGTKLLLLFLVIPILVMGVYWSPIIAIAGEAFKLVAP
ncbi:NADH-quinone oxidoreductase subunit N [bacterium]|nr:NADH-quinone oxidoreductase subunit N [bacterium]